MERRFVLAAPYLFELSSLASGDRTAGFIINGIDRGDLAGHEEVTIGDVNGDGFSDLVIGARCADPHEKDRAGESYVVWGSKAGGFPAVIESSSLDGSIGFVVNGIDMGDKARRLLGPTGDISGHGFDDLLIGDV